MLVFKKLRNEHRWKSLSLERWAKLVQKGVFTFKLRILSIVWQLMTWNELNSSAAQFLKIESGSNGIHASLNLIRLRFQQYYVLYEYSYGINSKYCFGCVLSSYQGSTINFVNGTRNSSNGASASILLISLLFTTFLFALLSPRAFSFYSTNIK